MGPIRFLYWPVNGENVNESVGVRATNMDTDINSQQVAEEDLVGKRIFLQDVNVGADEGL